MTRRLGVSEHVIATAACDEALRLMQAGEYQPLGGRDYTMSTVKLKRRDFNTHDKLKYLCLISDLRYTASNGKSRHITASKVVRDVLHCMLNLHEAGVQLNLETGNGK